MRPAKAFLTVIYFTVVFLLLAGCGITPAQMGGYAIVYGISVYDPAYAEGALNNLTYTDDDAIAVSALFENSGYTVITRLNSEATVGNLTGDIEDAAAALGPNENFIFYYSGHGVSSPIAGVENLGEEPDGRDSFDEWIFLYNSINATGITDLSAALSDNDISALLSSLPTSRKIVILDACNSGGFIGSQLEIDNVPQNTYVSATDDGSSIREDFFDAISRYVAVPGGTESDLPSIDALVIAAAGEAEESFEASEYGHGVFTYHLLNAQTYGDSNNDGFITVGECFGYTEAMIAGWWDNPIYSFTPRISGGPVDFVLFESN